MPSASAGRCLVLEDILLRGRWIQSHLEHHVWIHPEHSPHQNAGDPAAGDHMEVHLQMLELLQGEVTVIPRPWAASLGDRGRERWLNSFIPAPITDLRHWKPSRIKELGPINQKVLEGPWEGNGGNRHLIPHVGRLHTLPLSGWGTRVPWSPWRHRGHFVSLVPLEGEQC